MCLRFRFFLFSFKCNISWDALTAGAPNLYTSTVPRFVLNLVAGIGFILLVALLAIADYSNADLSFKGFFDRNSSVVEARKVARIAEADDMAREGCSLFAAGEYQQAGFSFAGAAKLNDKYAEYAEKANFLSPNSYLSPWTEAERMYASQIEVMCEMLN